MEFIDLDRNIFLKNILLIGATFAGKSYFSKILVKDFDYSHYYLGDIVRKKYGVMGKDLSNEELEGLIAELNLDKKFIIDKVFKTVKQLNILNFFKKNKIDYIIINLERCFEIPLSSRGRADDYLLEQKIKNYRKKELAILNYLLENGEKVVLAKNLKDKIQFMPMTKKELKSYLQEQTK